MDNALESSGGGSTTKTQGSKKATIIASNSPARKKAPHIIKKQTPSSTLSDSRKEVSLPSPQSFLDGGAYSSSTRKKVPRNTPLIDPSSLGGFDVNDNKTTSQATTSISRQQSATSGGVKSAEVKQPSNSGAASSSNTTKASLESRKSAVKASSSVTSVSSGVVNATASKSKSSTLASSAAPKSSTQQQQKKQAAPPLPSDSKTKTDNDGPPIEDTEESLSTQLCQYDTLIKEADDKLARSLCVDRVHLLGRKAKITNEDSDLKDFNDATQAIAEDDNVTEEQRKEITARVEDIGKVMFACSML